MVRLPGHIVDFARRSNRNVLPKVTTSPASSPRSPLHCPSPPKKSNALNFSVNPVPAAGLVSERSKLEAWTRHHFTIFSTIPALRTVIELCHHSGQLLR